MLWSNVLALIWLFVFSLPTLLISERKGIGFTVFFTSLKPIALIKHNKTLSPTEAHRVDSNYQGFDDFINKDASNAYFSILILLFIYVYFVIFASNLFILRHVSITGKLGKFQNTHWSNMTCSRPKMTFRTSRSGITGAEKWLVNCNVETSAFGCNCLAEIWFLFHGKSSTDACDMSIGWLWQEILCFSCTNAVE